VALPDLPLISDGSIAGPLQPTPVNVGSNVYPWAPIVRASPDGRRLMIAQYLTVAEQIATVERFSAERDGTAIGGLARLEAGPGTLGDGTCSYPSEEAFATSDVYTALCSAGSRLLLRRVAPDGTAIGDTDLSVLGVGESGFFGNAATVAPDSTIAYYWGAFSRTILKLDLATGEVLQMATLPAPTAAAGDPLSALAGLGRWFGSWIAPSGLAKLYLDPALAISPDGSRLYLVGTNATRFDDVSAGSAGVWVSTRRRLGRRSLAATADSAFRSQSRDGRSSRGGPARRQRRWREGVGRPLPPLRLTGRSEAGRPACGEWLDPSVLFLDGIPRAATR
jgi:hypothetical protein